MVDRGSRGPKGGKTNFGAESESTYFYSKHSQGDQISKFAVDLQKLYEFRYLNLGNPLLEITSLNFPSQNSFTIFWPSPLEFWGNKPQNSQQKLTWIKMIRNQQKLKILFRPFSSYLLYVTLLFRCFDFLHLASLKNFC